MNMFVLVLLGGFAGSFHCIGMCGGIACGLAQANRGSKRLLLLKNLMYNSGRLLSYAFIGALAGALGTSIIQNENIGLSIPTAHASAHGSGIRDAGNTVQSTLIHGDQSANQNSMTDSVTAMDHASISHWTMNTVLSGELGLAQRVLSVLAGLLMLVMAMELLGFRRHVPASWGEIGGIAIARVINTLVQSNRPSASVALGVANGFLPCPLVMSFAAIAAASASVAGGFLTMVAFGLGTFPAMFLMSGVGLALSPIARRRGVRVAGTFVMVFGIFTMSRGLMAGSLQ